MPASSPAEFASEFHQLDPQLVVRIGERYEAFAAAA
jgi:hypothetical protein